MTFPLDLPHVGGRAMSFSYGRVRFHVEVSANLYAAQRDHLAHYLPEVAVGGPSDVEQRVRVTAADAAYAAVCPTGAPERSHNAFGADHYGVWRSGETVLYRPVPPLSAWLRDDHVIAVRGNSVDVVTRSDAAAPESYLMYVLREVVLRVLEDMGGVQFHAACVTGPAGAVMIVGDKGAGKTSTATNLVAGGAYGFAANDRTFVVDGCRTVFGMPLALRLGYGLVAGTPRLAEHVRTSRLARPQMRTSDDTAPPEVFGSRIKHILTPREFVSAMGTDLVEGDRLRLVLLPAIADGDQPLWSAPSPPAETIRVLTDSCYTPTDPAFREPRFREPMTSRAERAQRAGQVCEQLARTVPVLRVGWGVALPHEQVAGALQELCRRWTAGERVGAGDGHG